MKLQESGVQGLRKIDTICFVFTIFILVTVPLVFDKTNYQVFALPKSFLLKFGIGLMGIVWAISQLSRTDSPSLSDKAHTFFYPLVLFVLTCLLATVFSIDPWMSLVGVYGRFFGLQGLFTCFVAYLIITSTSNIKGKLNHNFIIVMAFISGSIVGLYALMQYLALDPFLWFLFPFEKVYSTTGNANFCGNLLALIFPFSFFVFFLSQRKFNKFLSLLGTLFILAGIICSTTRGAWAATFVSSIGIVILSKYFLFKKNEGQSFKGFFIHSFLFLTLFFLMSWFTYCIFERPENAFYPLPFLRLVYVFWPQTGNIFTRDNPSRKRSYAFFAYSAISLLICVCLYLLGRKIYIVLRLFNIFELNQFIRIYLWKDFFALIKDNFFLGVGPETYRRAFLPFKSLELALLSGGEEHDNPHNVYLSLWGAMGILGPICLLWISYKLFKDSWNVFSSNIYHQIDKILGISFFCMNLSYLVWSFFAFDTVVNIPIYFAFLSAFAIWKYSLKLRDPLRPSHPLSFTFSFLLTRKTFKTVFLSICVPIFLFGSYIVYHQRVADQHFLRSISLAHYVQRLLAQKRVNEAIPIISESIEHVKKALIYNPQESHYYYQLSRLIFEQAKLEQDESKRLKILTLHDAILAEAQKHPWAPESLLMEKVYSSILKKSFDQAIRDADTALKLTPFRIDLRQVKEKLYYSSKYWTTHPTEINNIIENSQIILKFNPDYLFSRLFLIDLFILQRDFISAMDQVYFLRENFPNEKVSIMNVVKRIDLARRSYAHAGLSYP